MKYLIDNNLPPGLADALSALDPNKRKVVSLVDKFGTGKIDDVDWLPQLVKEGSWVVITQDYKSKSAQERALWRDQKLTVFFLEPSWDHQKLWPKVSKLMLRWEEMCYFAEKAEPDQYMVPFKGKIRKA